MWVFFELVRFSLGFVGIQWVRVFKRVVCFISIVNKTKYPVLVFKEFTWFEGFEGVWAFF